MATNSIVRLILDSDQFTKALGKARNEADDMTNVTKGMVGAVGKIAGALGVAMGATELFNKVIESSNELTDEWDKVMRSATSTVDAFFTSIATGDFTAFNNGIDAMIEKARNASGALDQLWNTTASFSYFQSKNMASFDEQMAIIKDKEATPEQVAAAKEEAKKIMANMSEYTGELSRRTMETLGALVVEGNALDASQITTEALDKVLLLDITKAGDAQKEELKRRYQEYALKSKEITLKHTKQITEGFTSQSGVYVPAQTKTDYEAVNRELAAINNEYLDAIVYNEVLVKKSDDWLQNLINIANTSANAERQLAGMQKTFNRQAGGGSGTGGGKGGKTTKTPAVAGSIAAIDEAIKAAQTAYANAVGVEAQTAAHKTLEELKRQKGEIEFIVKFTDGKGRELKDLTMADMPSGLPTKGSLTNTPLAKFTPPITDSNVATVDNYVDSLNAVANVMGALNAANVEGAAGWLTYAGNLMTASAMAVEAVRSVVAAKTAEAAASGAAEAAKTPLVGWLMVGGAIASVLAAMASIPSFATGGIVGGSNYTDGITARVSSGEMVINEADQKKLYEQIHGGGIGGGGGRAVVTGEQIVLAVNNYGKRTGRGELI